MERHADALGVKWDELWKEERGGPLDWLSKDWLYEVKAEGDALKRTLDAIKKILDLPPEDHRWWTMREAGTIWWHMRTPSSAKEVVASMKQSVMPLTWDQTKELHELLYGES
jgi:hypothetical protein